MVWFSLASYSPSTDAPSPRAPLSTPGVRGGDMGVFNTEEAGGDMGGAGSFPFPLLVATAGPGEPGGAEATGVAGAFCVPCCADRNTFMQEEVKRLKDADPKLKHAAAFKLAATNWEVLEAGGTGGASSGPPPPTPPAAGVLGSPKRSSRSSFSSRISGVLICGGRCGLGYM